MISPTLIEAILKQYKLPHHGLHGPVHWGRVLENGLRLAKLTGANTQVVELFAVFHDACRLNEDYDPQHGSRGADLANSLRGKFFTASDDEITMLKVACRLHTEGLTEADITVQACWDADRLDLGRVGIKPHASRLCTDAAKDFRMIEWADDRAAGGVIPGFVEQDWLNSNVKAK